MKKIITADTNDRSIERMRDDLDIALSDVIDNATFLSKHSNEIPDIWVESMLHEIAEMGAMLGSMKRSRTVAGKPKRRLEGTLYEWDD